MRSSHVFGWALLGGLVIGGCTTSPRPTSPPSLQAEGDHLVAVGVSSGEATPQAAREAARTAAIGNVLRRIGVRVTTRATYHTEGVKAEGETRVTFRSRERTRERTPELVFRGLRVTRAEVVSRDGGFEGRVTLKVPRSEIARHRRRRQELTRTVTRARQAAREAARRGDWSGMMTGIREALTARARYRSAFLAGPHEDLEATARRMVAAVSLQLAAGGQHSAGEAPFRPVLVATYRDSGGEPSPLRGVPVRVVLPSGRAADGVTGDAGQLRLTLPPPQHAGRYTLRARVLLPWHRDDSGAWPWSGEPPADPVARLPIQVAGAAEGVAQGRFHPFEEVKGTGWAPIDGNRARARQRARRAALIDAQAQLVEGGRITRETTVADQQLVKDRIQRRIAGQVPEGWSVVSEEYREAGGKVQAAVVLRLAQEDE